MNDYPDDRGWSLGCLGVSGLGGFRVWGVGVRGFRVLGVRGFGVLGLGFRV